MISKLFAVAAGCAIVAATSAPTPALAGNSYWEPSCAYVSGPKGTMGTVTYPPRIGFAGFTGRTWSKGLIACTHCGKTTYTYNSKVLGGSNGHASAGRSSQK
jgi:hypothetical protein